MQLTEHQRAALAWGLSQYGRGLRKRLNTRPEEQRKGYSFYWYVPFGIGEWNEITRVLRRMLWQGKLKSPTVARRANPDAGDFALLRWGVNQTWQRRAQASYERQAGV